MLRGVRLTSECVRACVRTKQAIQACSTPDDRIKTAAAEAVRWKNFVCLISTRNLLITCVPIGATRDEEIKPRISRGFSPTHDALSSVETDRSSIRFSDYQLTFDSSNRQLHTWGKSIYILAVRRGSVHQLGWICALLRAKRIALLRSLHPAVWTRVRLQNTRSLLCILVGQSISPSS